MDEKTKERRAPAAARENMKTAVKRGDIFYADLSPVVGSEQGGLRPVLVIQNDVGNRYSPTVIVAAITSKMGKTKLPTHIDVNVSDDREHTEGLAKDSVILLEQVRTIDKRRLRERVGHISSEISELVDRSLLVSLGLVPRSVLRDDPDFRKIAGEEAVAASTIGV